MKIRSFFIFFLTLMLSVITSSGVSHAVFMLPFAFHQSAKVLFTTAAQTLHPEVCSSVVTVQRYLGGKGHTASSALVVNVVGTGTVTFYSDPSCTNSISSVTISATGTTANFYIKTTAVEAVSMTASANAYVPATQNISSITNPFVWTGNANDNIWQTAANWSGGAAPGTGGVATFDGTCVTFCSPQITSSISVLGVLLTSSYTGTITQNAGSVITTAARGWVQKGGTFVGSSAGDAVTGTAANGPFYLGGGSYTATSGTFTAFTPQWVVTGTGTFIPNGGFISFTGFTTGSLSITPGSGNYHNVQLGGSNMTYSITGTMNVVGTLTITSGTQSTINTGILSARGDVLISGNGLRGAGHLRIEGSTTQNIDATTATIGAVPTFTIASTGGNVNLFGRISIYGSYTMTSGNLVVGTSEFGFNMSTSGLTINPGSVIYNVVTLYSATTNAYTLTGTWNIAGKLTFNSTNQFTAQVNGGTISARGTIEILNYGFRGTTALHVTGSTSQTIDGTGSLFPLGGRGGLPAVTVLSTGGTVNLVGTIYVNSSFIFSTGTLNAGTSTLGLISPTITFDPGGATYHSINILINQSSAVANITGNITATGDVVISGAGTTGSVAHMPSSGGPYSFNITGNLEIDVATTLNLHGASLTYGSLTNNGTLIP